MDIDTIMLDGVEVSLVEAIAWGGPWLTNQRKFRIRAADLTDPNEIQIIRHPYNRLLGVAQDERGYLLFTGFIDPQCEYHWMKRL